MRWTEEYSTGVPKVDEQHKVLFKAVNDYRKTFEAGEMEAQFDATLKFLAQYSRGHFTTEEHCMDEYRCPAAQKNKEAHVGLTTALGGFIERYEANGYSAEEAQTLLETLEAWLDDHIKRVDCELRKCVTAQTS